MTFEILISIANLINAYSMIPSIISKEKPHRKTSFLLALASLMFVVAFVTTKQWIVVAWNVIMFVGWTTLFIQKYREDK